MSAAIETTRAAGEVVRDSPALLTAGEPGGLPPRSSADPERRGQAPPLAEEIAPNEDTWLFLKPLLLAETGAARQIHALRQGPHPMSGANVVAMVKWVE